MSTRYYPLFRHGNPQLRIFLPNFWMKLIRHKEPMPPNYVLFQTSVEMTSHDVKNYLEKIYKVPVVDVRTTHKPGKIRQAYGKDYLVQDDEYKEALVILAKGEKFEFPKIAERKTDFQKEMNEAGKEMVDISKKKGHFHGIPKWFV